MIRIGFGRTIVAFLGRWGSNAIMVYIEEVTVINAALAIPVEAEPEQPEPPPAVRRAEAPEDKSAESTEELATAWKAEVERLQEALTGTDFIVKDTEDRITQLEKAMAAVPTRGDLEELRDGVREMTPTTSELEAALATLQRGPKFVTDKGAEMYHVVASAHPLDNPAWHRTRCGWDFGFSTNAVRSDTPPTGLRLCHTCGGTRR